MTPRHDGRAPDALRPIEIVPHYLDNPAGSVLIHCGRTRVLCTASVDDRTPPFLHGSGEGWVSGEYCMIPAATDKRSMREVHRGRPSGRTMEIQRLIGRAMRSVVDRAALGERTIWIDCEVLQADGGTRTTAITGGFLAMCLAIGSLRKDGLLKRPPLTGRIAATSVGIVEGRPVLDLDYVEDSAADVDMNVVRTDAGRYVEIQGTGEDATFARDDLDGLLELADIGIERLLAQQKELLGDLLPLIVRES
jgi:ribonuclease PH